MCSWGVIIIYGIKIGDLETRVTQLEQAAQAQAQALINQSQEEPK